MKEEKILIRGLKSNFKIKGEGKPLLILHGWSAASDSWVEIQNRLSSEGYQVICPDFPGFGKSENPPEPWSVTDYMDWTLDFVNHFNLDRFYLISHSFGGRVAIKLAVYHPEKLEKLVLCGSAGIKAKPCLKTGLICLLAESGNSVFNTKCLKIFRGVTKNIFYLFLRRYDYVKAKGVMKETLKKVVDEDLLPYLSKISTKTLLVWGRKDKMVPVKYAEIFKKNIKNSQLKILPKIGHGPHLEVPEKLSEIIIQFLKS